MFSSVFLDISLIFVQPGWKILENCKRPTPYIILWEYLFTSINKRLTAPELVEYKLLQMKGD